MSLIASISGIRGTIGGQSGENLTPSDILRFSLAYGSFIKKSNPNKKPKIVIGRDARISGEMVRSLVAGALSGIGVDVVDIGLAATPTVELAVVYFEAQGGVIITASHNPSGWNALKLLNSRGEFLSKEVGDTVLEIASGESPEFASEDSLGEIIFDNSFNEEHIKQVLELPLVDKNLIAARNFKVVVDGINSVGGVIIVNLLKKLGVDEIFKINCDPTGLFAHKPEPLAANLQEVMSLVRDKRADLGIVVDPDVDRLVFIDENGEMFGEEYTLVAIADYVLENFKVVDKINPGRYNLATVSNLSSSRALRDITEKHQGKYEAAAVGEVNVVDRMKEVKAVIGGEGNGGVIFPEAHYGRDALVGVALFLSCLARKTIKISEFKKSLPQYFMIKDRIDLGPGINVRELILKIKEEYKLEKITDIDGIKIDYLDSWVHLRASNTEPIIRIYAEARSLNQAQRMVEKIKKNILAIIK